MTIPTHLMKDGSEAQRLSLAENDKPRQAGQTSVVLRSWSFSKATCFPRSSAACGQVIKSPFPGFCFDGHGRNLVPGGRDLSSAQLSSPDFARSFITRESVLRKNQPPNAKVEVARMWCLKFSVTFANIPPSERQAAHAILRSGLGVLVFSTDPSSEEAVRLGLLKLLEGDSTSVGRYGHA